MTVSRDIPHIADAVYQLTPADGNPSSRANLQFVLFYQTDKPIPPLQRTHLRQSYFQTLLHYPIFHGRLHRHPVSGHSDQASISVTPLSKATLAPSYTEHLVDQPVAEIAQAKYHWDAWPPELLSIPVIREQHHEVPLAQCVVTWHPDGMGVLFSVDHSVADGVGVDILLRQWAGMARDGEMGVPVDFDHAGMYAELDGVVAQEDHWFVRHVDGVQLPLAEEQGAECSAILDSDPRTPRQVEQAMRRNVHCFTMTPAQLLRLQSDSAEPLPAIRLAYALFWQRYMHALQAAPCEPTLVNIIHSTRSLISRPHYIGNAVCPVYIRMPAQKLARQSVAEVAQEIGRHMHMQTKGAWAALLQMMQDPGRYRKFLTVFGNPQAKQMSLSNISRLRFFDADFGFGAPRFVSVYPALIPGFATWMPLGPEGGLRILWNIADQAFERMANDPMLTKYVDVVF
ncbi:hypothetical protein GGI15_004150 [Coemansia interrupta]|uniref:Uncharacterized protein n=1 Tax=Coemansia interrupta TaxID=1126814 RepID=A0A9W8LEP0_9FUNG|nr:hypothetical protein GGI15_004150 [Coemansia interrupta]